MDRRRGLDGSLTSLLANPCVFSMYVPINRTTNCKRKSRHARTLARAKWSSRWPKCDRSRQSAGVFMPIRRVVHSTALGGAPGEPMQFCRAHFKSCVPIMMHMYVHTLARTHVIYDKPVEPFVWRQRLECTEPPLRRAEGGLGWLGQLILQCACAVCHCVCVCLYVCSTRTRSMCVINQGRTNAHQHTHKHTHMARMWTVSG